MLSSSLISSINLPSPSPPSVITPRAWVWPLVNNAEPWVLSNKPTLENSGLNSSVFLPSGLTFSFVISLLTSLVTTLSNAALTCFKKFASALWS